MPRLHLPPSTPSSHTHTHTAAPPPPQLATLARLAAGTLDASESLTTDASVDDASGGAALPELDMQDFRSTQGAAFGAVDVPDAVIDLLTGVRNYLQAREERCICVCM